MVINFLRQLGLTVKQHGKNVSICCLNCDDDGYHLQLLVETGHGRCLKCDWRANLYKIAQTITQLQPREIFELLEKHGVNSHDYRPEPKKKTTPELSKDDLRPLFDLERISICYHKQLDLAALEKFAPWAHRKQPWMMLPAFEPGDLNKACGWMRVRIDGQPVYDFTDDTGKRKVIKYPIVSGSTHGLFGLKAITGDTILFCEAWRDALAAISLGYTATASSGGASTWNDNWKPVFEGRTVYIIMDQDEAGQRAARRAAKALYKVARVYIVELPYELKDSHGEDLHDYIVRDGHTRDQMAELLERAKLCTKEDFLTTNSDDAASSTDTGDTIILPDDHPDTIAEAFEEWSLEKCGVRHKYHPHDGWSIYRDGRYQTVEPHKQIAKYLSKYLKNCHIEAGKKKAIERIRISNRRISDILTQLSYLDNVYLKPSEAAPCSLDGSLDPRYIIALNNGLLNWKTHPYQLLSHTESYYNLNYLPYNWEGEKDSELWIKFLIDATNGDEELFEMLQQWAGYCLMKHDQKEQKFLIIYGEAGTGKSVFVDVLTHLLGKANIAAIPLEKFNDPHYVVQTYGKMLNVTDESESHLEEAIETHLKHYTGGTVYTFKRLYQEPFSAYPTAKIMIVTNHLPGFRDTSEGVWRRLLLAPFETVVPETKRIKGLSQKIIETEMPGVLKWALEGARKLEKFGFVEPEICKEAMAEYRREATPEIQFLEENYEPCEPDEYTGRIKCKEFRNKYEEWCKSMGVGIKSQKRLTRTIKKMFPLCERKRGRDNLKLEYFYYGITERL